MRRLVAISSYTAWCGLGFKRGSDLYVNEKDKPYLYSCSFLYGIYGTFMYANPCFIPFLFHKEMYRLEVNSRNLEEKKSTTYKDIF
jgi:hypothetical protein